MVSISTAKPSYLPGDKVLITLAVTSSNGATLPYLVIPVDLTLANGVLVAGTAYGTHPGLASVELTLPRNAALGTGTITCTVTIAGYPTASGTATISVT